MEIELKETETRSETKVTMREAASLVVNGLLDLVYPPRCLVCAQRIEEGALCEACRQEMMPAPPAPCERCGWILGAGWRHCPQCHAGDIKAEWPIAWSQTLGVYSGALRNAIHRLKYDGKTALARPLGEMLARSLDQPPSPLLVSAEGEVLTFDAVVPVPLHPSRLRQRGFNQAERIARIVARERGWPLDAKGVVRIHRTKQQADLSQAQRIENVRGAFACRPYQRFAGKSVLIVDDVLTTLNTSLEVARVARDAGASRICVIALARGV